MLNSEAEVTNRNFEEDDFPLIPDDARNLSKEILLGANSKKPRQMHREILESMTHLKMAQMKLSSLIQVDLQGNPKPLLAEHCPNLQILYLQENYLTFIGP